MSKSSHPDDTRAISRSKLVYLYISSVLGVGILIVPGITVQYAGGAAIFVWLALGGLCAAIATMFAKISTQFPHASGVRDIIESSLGAFLSQYATIALLVVYVVGNPAMGISTAQYLQSFVDIDLSYAPLAFGLMVFSIGLTVLPAKILGTVQVWAMRIALTAILLAIVIAIPSMEWSNLTSREFTGIRPTLAAAGIAMYAYLGWENVSLLAGRVKSPEKSFRWAIRWAVPIVASVYLIAAVAFSTLPSGGGTLLVPALTADAPAFVRLPILAASVVALIAATNAWVLGGVSLFEDRLRAYNVPGHPGVLARGILVVGYGAVLLCTHLGIVDLERLLLWTSCLFMTVYALAAYAVIREEKRATLSAVVIIAAATVVLISEQTLGLILLLFTVVAIATTERRRHVSALRTSHHR